MRKNLRLMRSIGSLAWMPMTIAVLSLPAGSARADAPDQPGTAPATAPAALPEPSPPAPVPAIPETRPLQPAAPVPPAPAPSPAPEPAPSAAAAPAPDTQRAPARALANKVVVLRFQSVDGANADSWIGRSIQQSLVTDLAMSAGVPFGTSDAAPADAPGASQAGVAAGVRYVVYGQFVVNDTGGTPIIRVTGQLLESGTDRTLAAMKSTGPLDDLFDLEDDFARQLRAGLSQSIQRESPATARTVAPQSASPAPQIAYSGPVTTTAQQPNPWVDYGANYTMPPGPYNYYYGVPAYGDPYYYGDGTYWGTGYPSYYSGGYPNSIIYSPIYYNVNRFGMHGRHMRSTDTTGTNIPGRGNTPTGTVFRPPGPRIGPLPSGPPYPGPRGTGGGGASGRATFGHIFAPQSATAGARRR